MEQMKVRIPSQNHTLCYLYAHWQQSFSTLFLENFSRPNLIIVFKKLFQSFYQERISNLEIPVPFPTKDFTTKTGERIFNGFLCNRLSYWQIHNKSIFLQETS